MAVAYSPRSQQFQLHQQNNLLTATTMKKYLRPEFEIFEVAVEGGYGDSVLLPGFGSESDELVY